MDATHLAFAGPSRQRDLLRHGKLKVRDLVELYLSRIQRLNGRLNAYRVVLSDTALEAAEAAQQALDAGTADDQPLLGIPFAVKDNMDLAGEVTTEGTNTTGPPAAADAEIVKRLRNAGAIPLGKTLTPELCLWPFTESPTWGVTRNPWAPLRTPGGSSGGSAAAVAAGLASFATGSDGGGSIRIPAACCGLFGLKVQRDRVPLLPRREIWNGLSVYGVLTRRVHDAALVYDVIGGGVPCAPHPLPRLPATFAEAVRAPPSRLRVGVTSTAPVARLQLHPAVRGALTDTAERLRSLGHDVEDISVRYGMPAVPYAMRALDGAAQDAELLGYPELEPRARTLVRVGQVVPQSLVHLARCASRRIAARVNCVFERVDVLMTPVVSSLPLPIPTDASPGIVETLRTTSAFAAFTPIWNLTGQPAATVPAGFTDAGVPVAVQLVGPPNGELTLVALAAQLEAVADWAGRQPQFD